MLDSRLAFFSRLFRRDTKNRKTDQTVTGYDIADIDVLVPSEQSLPEPRHERFHDAVWIPTNEFNQLSGKAAQRLGVNAAVDNILLSWEITSPTKNPYTCSSNFLIKTNLPRQIIFGNQELVPDFKNYPCPFEGTRARDFDSSYICPKMPSTRSFKGVVKKTMSWKSSKSDSRSSTFRSNKSLEPSPATISETNQTAVLNGGIADSNNDAVHQDLSTESTARIEPTPDSQNVQYSGSLDYHRPRNAPSPPESDESATNENSTLGAYSQAYTNTTPSCSVKPEPVSPTFSLPKGTRRHSAHGTDYSSTRQMSRPTTQRIETRRKGPRFRRMKNPTEGDLRGVDLTALPGADSYWTYDEATRASFHVDSRTGTRRWLEDDSDSDVR